MIKAKKIVFALMVLFTIIGPASAVVAKDASTEKTVAAELNFEDGVIAFEVSSLKLSEFEQNALIAIQQESSKSKKLKENSKSGLSSEITDFPNEKAPRL